MTTAGLLGPAVFHWCLPSRRSLTLRCRAQDELSSVPISKQQLHHFAHYIAHATDCLLSSAGSKVGAVPRDAAWDYS